VEVALAPVAEGSVGAMLVPCIGARAPAPRVVTSLADGRVRVLTEHIGRAALTRRAP
jgi:hypothetical protein